MLTGFHKIGPLLLLTLVLVLAAFAYVLYRIASAGHVQPLTLIFLIAIGVFFYRVLSRILRKIHEGK